MANQKRAPARTEILAIGSTMKIGGTGGPDRLEDDYCHYCSGRSYWTGVIGRMSIRN